MDGSMVSLEGSDKVSLSDGVSREETEKLERVLLGELNNLPSLSSRIVRIFTSSTFTDTTLERNALMEKVYPTIKEFCREKHGLEFQVVDMRWGIRDEATDDHMTTELCMKEIDNCQRLSMGPNFVVFLGQKYGYRPLPTHLAAKEFELLRECVRNVNSELELLEEWYKKDDNSVPPFYVLQPISSIFTNFNNKRNQRLQELDQASWWETFGKLQRIIRKAAQVLFITKKLDREQMHSYFMSVTEREIERGILKASNVDDHTLCYIREISNINTTLLRFAGKFVDLAARNVDGEAQKLLKTLRDDKLPKKLSNTNLTRFSVEWSGKEGIDVETHAEYLDAFCEHFFKSVTGLVDRAMAKHEKLANNDVYVETLQHLHACHMFCKVFQGREETVQKIHQYITDDTDKPFVLYGESGCGKTSLMAKGSSQVRSWVPDGVYPVLVLRFLGTTPHSSSIIPLLTSLCKQLAFVFDQPETDIPDELAPLIQHFKKLMACATAQKPLVIFLDSLDQLSGADGAHQLAWIPIQLPPHVKMVVSTLPNYYNLLNTLQKMLEKESCFEQILPLGENLSSTILKLWLKNTNKAITDQQWVIVNEAIAKCNLPLFVKLVFDEISRWRSYTSPKLTTLAFTIHDSIMKLFERIENQHGKTLVSHALGYITAAKNGLSEPELEDLLSIDEKVLNDVYQYHLPPVRRIPPLLWTRMRNDLPGYLSEREAEGVNVIGWYHRQFIDAAKERYFKNLNFVSEIHQNIAEYFLGTWGGGVPKPYAYSDLQRQRFQLEEKTGESDRKLPLQQLKFGDVDSKAVRYNLRKLSELPFHLVRSHRFECLFTEVLFNYKFLHAKISSMPLQALLADFEDFMVNVYDKDAKLLADALRLSSSILSHYPDMLGPQIVGRLLPHYGSNQKIKVLIDQCDSDGLMDCALVPSHHCLHTPGGPLQYSLEGHPFAPFGIGVTSDAKYLVSVSNKFIIWDTSSGEVFRTVTPGIGGIMQNLLITPDDKHAVSFTNNNQILVCNILTGDYDILTGPVDKKLGDINGISVTNTHVVVWNDSEWARYTLSGKCEERQVLDEHKVPLTNVQLGDESGTKRYFSLKSGMKNDEDLALEVQGENIEPFEYHSALALTKDRKTLYSCIEISDNAVVVYKLSDNSWKYDRTLGDNVDGVFSLKLSDDEKYLVATLALGYKLWDLRTDVLRQLKLPHGIRNIPTRNQLTSHVVFTKNNHFIVAGVRKNLYVWDVKQGNLVKTLDAHFGRIIALCSVCRDINTVISSSMDKTIKVWNFNNILEDVFSIDRHDKPIETLRLATNSCMGVTTTRNSIGVWNLESGKLLKTLGTSSHSSIIIDAAITGNGDLVIAAETMKVMIWDVETETSISSESQKDIQQLILSEEDTRFITLSKPALNKGKCVCREIPSGNEIYQFEYNLKTFRQGVVTCDSVNIVIPSYDKSGDTLNIFNAKTGSHSHHVQLKFSSYKDILKLIAMPHDPNQVAIIDSEKGNIIDLKKKSFVRSVSKWNGMCTQNGKIGLYAPNRGGMDMIELKHGKTVKTLIPRIAEGVFKVMVKFTQTDQHVLYYHSGHRTIRVFRTSDGKMIANFKAHAAVKVMEGSSGGSSVVLGCEDGSLTVLTIADPTSESSVEFLKSLPSRQCTYTSGSPSRKGALKGINGELLNGRMSVGTALQVARFVAKARGVQQSRACVIS